MSEIKETFQEPCDMYYTIFTPKGGDFDQGYKYRQLSPFEFKNTLIQKAEICAKKYKLPYILNAGRGNPNFFSTIPRFAFSILNDISTQLGDECYSSRKSDDIIGVMPPKAGIAKRFDTLLHKQTDNPEKKFLIEAIEKMHKICKLQKDEFIYQLVISTLGCYYPDPPRVQQFAEPVLIEFMNKIVYPNYSMKRQFDIFPTEGATAAMVYVFNSLKFNGLVVPGDKVGILTPIFTPYIEIPRLKNYRLTPICITSDEENNWEIPIEELQKIKDTNLKALIVVNPTNPTSRSLSEDTVKNIKKIVHKDNPNLIIIADNVYSPFVDQFHSLLDMVPKNVISIYSFSKYFGTTGWRLGCIILHKNNIIDKKLLPQVEKDMGNDFTRYNIIDINPRKIKFIDRLLIDSRQVTLAHTAGLSTPQQTIMCLFGMHDYLDKKRVYNETIKALLLNRIESLVKPLEYKLHETPLNSNYYLVLDIKKVVNNLVGGSDFGEYLEHHCDPLEFLIRLADEYATVLLPAVSFAGPFWSFRISIANLPDEEYPKIGENIRNMIDEYYEDYQKYQKKQKKKKL